ncbi:MAG: hypothetical protein ACYDCY_11050 [Metallibacterium sp.]
MALAAALVVLEHRGKVLLERRRHALAHHADAVDRVHQRLRLAFEQVADQHLEHGRPSASGK